MERRPLISLASFVGVLVGISLVFSIGEDYSFARKATQWKSMRAKVISFDDRIVSVASESQLVPIPTYAYFINGARYLGNGLATRYLSLNEYHQLLSFRANTEIEIFVNQQKNSQSVIFRASPARLLMLLIFSWIIFIVSFAIFIHTIRQFIITVNSRGVDEHVFQVR
jgi:hypothetical protein